MASVMSPTTVVPIRMTGLTPILSAMRPIGHRLTAPKKKMKVEANENSVRDQPNSLVSGIRSILIALKGRMLVAKLWPIKTPAAILILRGEKSPSISGGSVCVSRMPSTSSASATLTISFSFLATFAISESVQPCGAA